MEKLIFGSVVLLLVVAGLIIFIKDIITAAKNPSFKEQGNKYYIQPTNWWHGMAGYQNTPFPVQDYRLGLRERVREGGSEGEILIGNLRA